MNTLACSTLPDAPTAVLYRRVSTDHQDNSLEVQETLNDEYCRRLHFPVLATFPDEDVSGSIPFAERAGGRSLLHTLQADASRTIKHLITSKQDRLGRDTLDTVATIRYIWGLGITPHFTAEGGAFPRTSQNELLFEIKASVAQYERNLIRERTRAVMKHKFDRHQLTGNVPFGYDCRYTFASGAVRVSPRALSPAELIGPVVSKELIDNPAEQALLREMAAWRAAGMTLVAIADRLNAAGHLTKLGCRWQFGHIDSVLKSRHTQRLLGSADFQSAVSQASSLLDKQAA